MGNKRKPDNIHLLKNTYRPDRHGDPKKKLKVNAKFPIQPAWLPKNAKAEWARIKKIMEKSGVITMGDATVFIQYCLLYSEMKDYKEEFPAAKHAQLRVAAAELGLTPVARSKITVTKEEDNEF